VVASPYQRPDNAAPAELRRVPARPLELIQGSLSAERVERQAPWLAGLHRAMDGTLAGLGIAMLGLSGLTLYWQNQWSDNYQLLERNQVLEHRLQEAAAVLEQHHLAVVRRPGWAVPTSSEKLIYLPPPTPRQQDGIASLLEQVAAEPIPAGY
jgi:hypothetical protein